MDINNNLVDNAFLKPNKKVGYPPRNQQYQPLLPSKESSESLENYKAPITPVDFVVGQDDMEPTNRPETTLTDSDAATADSRSPKHSNTSALFSVFKRSPPTRYVRLPKNNAVQGESNEEADTMNVPEINLDSGTPIVSPESLEAIDEAPSKFYDTKYSPIHIPHQTSLKRPISPHGPSYETGSLKDLRTFGNQSRNKSPLKLFHKKLSILPHSEKHASSEVFDTIQPAEAKKNQVSYDSAHRQSSSSSSSVLGTPFKNVIRKISKHVYFDRVPRFSGNESKLSIPEGHRLEPKNDLYLYEEEMEEKLPATSILSALTDYQAAIPSNRPTNGSIHANGSIKSGKDKSVVVKRNKLGTMMGVFLPCIQNIFGVILFLRMNWIVGIAGAFQSVLIIIVCCSVTFITAISMSAIATNGIVPAGGSYFMISRSLGPEFGGAVGFLFYLATAFAVAMYTIGAVEILLEYLTPTITIFEDRYNNFRVYGACFLVVMTLIVMVGVRLVNKIAAVSLFCVLFSILTIYIGVFAYFKGNPNVQICLVGDQLIKKELYGSISNCYKIDGSGNLSTKIWDGFCKGFNNVSNTYYGCNEYFLNHNVTKELGIPGLGSGVFLKNMKSKYMKTGEANPGEPAINKYIVQAYIATSFTILLGIYFPSVTGIMAGSNRSGDLADAQKSIPVGTLAAIVFTSVVYVSSALLFAACIANPLLRDKFGAGIGGGMIVANLGWPHPLIVTIGSFLSTIGAALQSLTGAPRLLQAIAKDNIVPFLKYFTKTAKNGEPLPALLLTFFISLLGICIGNLDFIAPILTMFFLMCYGFVNLACALQTLLRTPNWRPRFKYYHWFLSLIGLALCLAAMFITSWYYALIAMFIAYGLYKYIEYYGAEKEWGDGVKGLQLSTALFSLLRCENVQQQQSLKSPNSSILDDFPSATVNTFQKQPHTKNWRPQLLVLCEFCSIDEITTIKGGSTADVNALNLDLGMGRSLLLRGGRALVLKYPRILSFAHQLKAGHGLTVCATALQGDWIKDSQEAYIIKDSLRRHMNQEKVKGFCDVVMTHDIYSGIMDMIQLSGLGGLRHNCIMMAWPESWRDVKPPYQGVSQDAEDYNSNKTPSWKLFVDVVRAAHAGNLAILAMKSCNKFPDNTIKLPPGSTIDVWWIVHDGGLLMLLPFLLKQHKVWKHCTTRIFTVAQLEDNSVQLKKNLEKFIYGLRIKAQVEVVEMHKSDISAYTYERTLIMEQRNQLLRQLNLSRKESLAIVQSFADHAHGNLHQSSDPNIIADENNNNNNNIKPSLIKQTSPQQPLQPNQLNQQSIGVEKIGDGQDTNNSVLLPIAQSGTASNRPSIVGNKDLFQPQVSSNVPLESPPKDLASSYYGEGGRNKKNLSSQQQTDGDRPADEEIIPLNRLSPIPDSNKENDENEENVDNCDASNNVPNSLLNLPHAYVAKKRTQKSSNTINRSAKFSAPTDTRNDINNVIINNEYTFTAAGSAKVASPFAPTKHSYNRIDTANVKRMHAAIKLNQTIRDKSKNAQLVLLNMPGPPRNTVGDINYMEYLEVLTEGIDRVLLIRGSGQEVVTIYS